MVDFKQKAAELLKEKVSDLELQEIYDLIETPPNTDMGDLAFPCFKLAKIFRKAPVMIAEDIAKEITSDLFSKVENLGGYVNFFIDRATYVETVLTEVHDKKDEFGSCKLGEGKNVIVEFSSPNIAKPFHIGHIRTTVIGNALNNIYKFLGYNTIAINHLGDYGTQFGKLIVAIKAWGDRAVIETNPIPELLKLYIKFHQVADEQPELEDQAREWFTKLENGDEEATELWQWIRDVSLVEFNRVYDMLGIKFDSLAGESFYSDKMPAVLDRLRDRDVVEKSQGAEIVNLEEFGMPPALITKKDGSTLYITRDLAAAIYRKENYDFYKNIYVVGSQQNLHFSQWFKIIDLMGYEWAEDCVHVPFGMVALEEGTLSTRKGKVVFLEDVLNKAVDKTKEVIAEKNPDLENKDEIAKQVGIGAVVFQELSHSRIKDYVFSWEKTLSFEGESGPYVQYAHARACSVLAKATVDMNGTIDYSKLLDDDSLAVVRILNKFSDVVIDAARKNEPSVVTRFITDLAQAFNRFYYNNHVIVDDEELQRARVYLVWSVKQALSNGLKLIGVEAPVKM